MTRVVAAALACVAAAHGTVALAALVSPWTATPAPVASGYVLSTDFVDARNGFAKTVSDTARLFATTDGGTSWQERVHPAVNVADISFVDTSTGWAVGAGIGPTDTGSPKVLVTRDGGASWTEQAVPGASSRVVMVEARTADDVWAITSTEVLHTTDGGTHWNVRTTAPFGGRFETLAAANTTTVVIAGNRTAPSAGSLLVRTADGGATWTELFNPGTSKLKVVAFAGAKTGWAVGTTPSQLLRTDDGGATWRLLASPPMGGTPFALIATDSRHLTLGTSAELAGNVLLTSRDGGTTWRRIAPAEATAAIYDADAAGGRIRVVGRANNQLQGQTIVSAAAVWTSPYPVTTVLPSSPSATTTSLTRRAGFATFTTSSTLKTTSGVVLKGRTVVLERSKDARSWSRVASVTTDSRGRATRSIRLTNAGRTYYRWRFAGAGAYDPSLGRTLLVVVR